MHILEAVEQVALGVAVHVFEQIVGNEAARLALRRPSGQEAAGGAGGRHNAGKQGNSEYQLQHGHGVYSKGLGYQDLNVQRGPSCARVHKAEPYATMNS